MGRRSWCGEENADKISKPAVQPACGAIAQLGERIVRNDEVVGSIPTSSTNLLNCLPTFSAVSIIRTTRLIAPFCTVNCTVILRRLFQAPKNRDPDPSAAAPADSRRRRTLRAAATLAAVTSARSERRYPLWWKCGSAAFGLAPTSGRLRSGLTRSRARFGDTA